MDQYVVSLFLSLHLMMITWHSFHLNTKQHTTYGH